MTIIVKVAIAPLTYKSYESQVKTRVLKAELEVINEKYKMPDSYVLKQMYPHKLLRQHTEEGDLSDSDKMLALLSPMLPFIAVWLVLFYIALYGI